MDDLMTSGVKRLIERYSGSISEENYEDILYSSTDIIKSDRVRFLQVMRIADIAPFNSSNITNEEFRELAKILVNIAEGLEGMWIGEWLVYKWEGLKDALTIASAVGVIPWKIEDPANHRQQTSFLLENNFANPANILSRMSLDGHRFKLSEVARVEFSGNEPLL